MPKRKCKEVIAKNLGHELKYSNNPKEGSKGRTEIQRKRGTSRKQNGRPKSHHINNYIKYLQSG